MVDEHELVEVTTMGVTASGQSMLLVTNCHSIQQCDIEKMGEALSRHGATDWSWIYPEGGAGDIRIVVTWGGNSRQYVVLLIGLLAIVWLTRCPPSMPCIAWFTTGS